jgi:hypothetical protein
MKNSWIDIPNNGNLIYCLLYMYKFLCLKNNKISIFGVFQSFVFSQILAVLGNFGQIWAKFVALTVAESMPKDHLKVSKPHNF